MKCVEHGGRLRDVPSDRDAKRDLESIPEHRNTQFRHRDRRNKGRHTEHQHHDHAPARPVVQTKQSPCNEGVAGSEQECHVRSGQFESVHEMPSRHHGDRSRREQQGRSYRPEINCDRAKEERNDGDADGSSRILDWFHSFCRELYQIDSTLRLE